jgi:phosphogluconate dehydratase
VRNGDIVRLDADAGVLCILEPANWLERCPAPASVEEHAAGFGRELFASARKHAGMAELGATTFQHPDWAAAL